MFKIISYGTFSSQISDIEGDCSYNNFIIHTFELYIVLCAPKITLYQSKNNSWILIDATFHQSPELSRHFLESKINFYL